MTSINPNAPGSVLLFGGGRMGLAMLRGWLASGVTPTHIAVVDPTPSSDLLAVARASGIGLNEPLRLSAGQVVVLAVKPQKVAELADTLAAVVADDALLISIMAGKTLADLAGLTSPATAIVRAMPNLPAAVGRGMTVAVANAACGAAERARAAALLSSTGDFRWLDEEALIDAATGVSGSGPAYLFYLADCLTEAGVAEGLPRDIAEQLARATISGAGEMLRANVRSATELRRDVTSPGGTTEAGLHVLMADGLLQDLIVRTVHAATARARALAG